MSTRVTLGEGVVVKDLKESQVRPEAVPAGDETLKAPVSNRGRIRRRKTFNAMLPVATFVILIAAWWAVVELRDIPSYLLPSPEGVFPRIIEDVGILTRNAYPTIFAIAAGFGLTIVSAIPIGLALALSDTSKRALYPLIVFIQLIPKIAVAPLLLVWFGFGLESKVLLVLLLTFFPLLLASMAGFSILDDRLLYLTRSMGATTWQTFRFLRLPSALPIIFSGLKTSATIATTAAIVAEFVGANQGLGYLLLQGTSRLDTELIFAILFILTLIGLALNYLVEFLEFLMTPWQRGAKGDG
jgi:NitT/TauT family transport system permease protein